MPDLHPDEPAATAEAMLPPVRRRRAWWALPFALSLLFVLGVAAVLQWSDRRDLDDQQRTLIADALSLEAQLSTRIAAEQTALQALGERLAGGRGASSSARLAQQPEVIDGLRRAWISLTWLDNDQRLLAQLPEGAPYATSGGSRDEGGLSAHLSVPIKTADGKAEGSLVVRYAPVALLRVGVPWWLARKYDVRLVDGFGQNIASSGEAPPPASHVSHRVSLEPALPDAYLELTARERLVPWWRTLPMALIAVFLALISAATWLLKRQVGEVTRAESQWRTEAAWRRAMEDSLVVALRARDSEGRLVYVNRAFCDLVGLPTEALLGRLPPMPYWPPDTLHETMSRHRRNLAGQAPREGYEARWIHRDGRAIDVKIFEAPLVDAAGRHIGWMGSILDITQAKQLEERERRQTEAMAHQARLTMLGEVAATLAHELNQPLTAIASYNAGVVNSLQRAGVDHAVVYGALQRLGEQAAQAGAVVQRIREFLTRRGPQRERCDLSEVARRAVALLKRDLARHEVQVVWQVPDELPAVWADPVLIEQVVINLVRNASDELASRPAPAPAAAAGGGAPTNPAGRRIAVALAKSGERFVRLDVTDNGPGLNGRRVEQLCAPFYSTKSEGMGMGLAICRSILEAHRGVMDAGDAPGGGARFSFTLPAYDASAAAADASAALEA
jgi:two-component system sensor histidine kinase DctS